ncbi:hypothetical protein R1sor_011024 [Riccia sorocarpa]|uniref:Uncharacterized protein n=1 Tax=Riccia sorocarpa TaxID=122646 RepID=A0ABD3HZR3_9MARC
MADVRRTNLMRSFSSMPHQKKALHRQTSSPALGLKGHAAAAWRGHVDGKTGNELQVEVNESSLNHYAVAVSLFFLPSYSLLNAAAAALLMGASSEEIWAAILKSSRGGFLTVGQDEMDSSLPGVSSVFDRGGRFSIQTRQGSPRR